jgi:hypothetical protein
MNKKIYLYLLPNVVSKNNEIIKFKKQVAINTKKGYNVK